MAESTQKVLPSGEIVRVDPPSDDFPQGREVLVSAPDAVADRLPSLAADASTGYAALRAAQQERLRKARAAQKGTPPEKRFL